MRAACVLLLVGALCVLALSCVSVEAHRHRAHGTPAKGLDVSADQTCAGWRTSPPRIWSYHLHLLFDAHDKNNTAMALHLRDQFIDAFQPNHTCSSLYQGKEGLCMFDVIYEVHSQQHTGRRQQYEQYQ